MGSNQLRDLLNRLRWDRDLDAAGVALLVRHRSGGREAVMAVPFSSVVEVLADGVAVADGTYLPYHRIVGVRRGVEALWQRSASHEE